MQNLCRKFGIIALMVFSLLFFSAQHPAGAADDRSFYLSGYDIQVDINEDGSANIEERLIYDFSGDFNGVLRNIDYSDSGGLRELQVSVDRAGTLDEFSLNNGSTLDDGGNPGSYNCVVEGDLEKLKIFEPSSSETKTFVLKYKLLDVVTKYNDIAEFNRKLVDTGWEVPLDNIRITITLPEGANKGDLMIFAHGPLTGVSTILDANTVECTAPSVDPGTFVETRLLFPLALVPQASQVVQEDALPRIMDQEKTLAEEANQLREEAAEAAAAEEVWAVAGSVMSYGLIVICIILMIYLYFRFDKEHKRTFRGKYYRELPGDYPPAVTGALMSFKKIDSQDIMATIMDLARRKYVTISSQQVEEHGFFGSKQETQYSIVLNENTPSGELLEYERYLLDWMIGTIGDGTSVSFDAIKEYGKDSSTGKHFKIAFELWQKMVEEVADGYKFFDEKASRGLLIGVLAGTVMVFSGIGFIFLFPIVFSPILLIVMGIVCLIFSARIAKRSVYGNDQYWMWKAFKKFLQDFSHMEEASIPSLVVWEHYLVYAVALGVAKDVIRQLPLVFNDETLRSSNFYYMYGFGHYNGSDFSSSFEQSMDAFNDAIASSIKSSTTGSGGGFSGGSSGGGGGGGGGGAF